MRGVVGLVYVPEDDGGPKKHPCRDCYFCQWCSDTRCALCLDAESRSKTRDQADIFCSSYIKGR